MAMADRFPYDPDRFDAEILVDRLPVGRYDSDALALIFKVSRNAVNHWVRERKIPQPQLVEDEDNVGKARARNVWTREQFINIVYAGKPKNVLLDRPIEHGTNNGYRQHYRRDEVPCEECRLAHNAKARTYKRKPGSVRAKEKRMREQASQ